ncbi:MAG: hypothetical protein ACQESE_04025, partial [Nanobdellota archaeon]
QELSDKLWDDITHILDEKDVVSVDFAPGTKGVKSVIYEGEKNNPFAQTILHKRAPIEELDDLRHEFTMSKALTDGLARSGSFIGHSHPINLREYETYVDLNIRQAWAENLGSYASLQKDGKHVAQVYASFAHEIPLMEDILETDTDIDFESVDYENKLITSYEHLTGKPISENEKTLVRDIVRILYDLGGEEKPLLDYHHNNLAIIPKHALQDGVTWGYKYDTENKGKAPSVLEYTNLAHHSFDVVPADSYSDVKSAVLDEFSKHFGVNGSDLALASFAGMHARTLSFAKAWSDPKRTEERARLQSLLEHTINQYLTTAEAIDTGYRPLVKASQKQIETICNNL